jgi:hypothetical protein
VCDVVALEPVLQQTCLQLTYCACIECCYHKLMYNRPGWRLAGRRVLGTEREGCVTEPISDLYNWLDYGARGGVTDPIPDFKSALRYIYAVA